MTSTQIATDTDYLADEAHSTGVGSVAPLDDTTGQNERANRVLAAGVSSPSDPGPAKVTTTPNDESPSGVHHPNGGDRANQAATPIQVSPPSSPFTELRIFAETYEDVQRSRIALTNRLKRAGIVDDALAEAITAARFAERKLALAMKRSFREAAPSVQRWVLATPGLGEHTLARLLGVIGDPLVARPHHWEGDGTDRHLVADDPYFRTVSQLWSYCGHGDPARKRRKGMTTADGAALGNPRAKALVHIIGECAMKCDGNSGRRRSPYRDVYDAARTTYAERDGWSLGRQHNAAIRKTAKEILRDLWIVAHDDIPSEAVT